MTIMARYSGTCPECGGRWQPGDQIRVGSDLLRDGTIWRHAVCPDVADPLSHHNPVCGRAGCPTRQERATDD